MPKADFDFPPSKPSDYGTDVELARRNGWVWDGKQWVAPATREQSPDEAVVDEERARR